MRGGLQGGVGSDGGRRSDPRSARPFHASRESTIIIAGGLRGRVLLSEDGSLTRMLARACARLYPQSQRREAQSPSDSADPRLARPRLARREIGQHERLVGPDPPNCEGPVCPKLRDRGEFAGAVWGSKSTTDGRPAAFPWISKSCRNAFSKLTLDSLALSDNSG